MGLTGVVVRNHGPAGLVAEESPDGRRNDGNDGSRAAEHNGPGNSGLLVEGPAHVADGLSPEVGLGHGGQFVEDELK